MLSDLVAQQVVARRKALGMNREDLAKRVEVLARRHGGWWVGAEKRVVDPETGATEGGEFLSAAAIGNLETGRRGPDGVRRRTVTVDELMLLGAALEVPPMILLFPVGQEPSVELWPGNEAQTYRAWQWASGTGISEIEEQLPELDRERWLQAAMPLALYRDHDALEEGLAEAVTAANQAVKSARASGNAEAALTLIDLVWERWRRILQLRNAIDAKHYWMPPLPAVYDSAVSDLRRQAELIQAGS